MRAHFHLPISIWLLILVPDFECFSPVFICKRCTQPQPPHFISHFSEAKALISYLFIWHLHPCLQETSLHRHLFLLFNFQCYPGRRCTQVQHTHPNTSASTLWLVPSISGHGQGKFLCAFPLHQQVLRGMYI